MTCSSEEENMNKDEMGGGGGRSFSRVREVDDALPDDDDAVDIQHVRSQDMSK